MLSAFGDSWGSAWGHSWGSIETFGTATLFSQLARNAAEAEALHSQRLQREDEEILAIVVAAIQAGILP